MTDPAEGRPLRVAHLDHTTSGGGAEYALARMFAAGPSWSAVLLLPPTGGENVFTEVDGDVPSRKHGVAQRAGASSVGARGAARLGSALFVQAMSTRMRREFRTADVIDANTSRAAGYAALAARTSRVPFVVHLRDMVDPDALGGAGYRLMTRVVLPRVNGVIANSQSTLESAAPYLRKGAATAVIPSASGLHRRPARVAETGKLRVGMLARIDPWKGQDLLIDAFAAAFPHGSETLELAGGAPFGHSEHVYDLRQRVDTHGLTGRVSLPGHVADVDTLLDTWDIGVQASLRPEPMGQNVLQYLASGLPTIVADEGGPTEWVTADRNGLRVPPRDVGALAEALRRLADDPGLRTRLSAAAVATPGLMTDDEVTAAHAAFYAQLAGRGRSGRR